MTSRVRKRFGVLTPLLILMCSLQLVSCKWLDLRCEDHDRKIPLQ